MTVFVDDAVHVASPRHFLALIQFPCFSTKRKTMRMRTKVLWGAEQQCESACLDNCDGTEDDLAKICSRLPGPQAMHVMDPSPHWHTFHFTTLNLNPHISLVNVCGSLDGAFRVYPPAPARKWFMLLNLMMTMSSLEAATCVTFLLRFVRRCRLECLLESWISLRYLRS